MTAANDLDRMLGAWFGEQAEPAPPSEPLARILESTRARRPRPSLVARIGSDWVGRATWLDGGVARRAPVVVLAVVALIVVALAAGALFVGRRMPDPSLPSRLTYLDQLVSAPDLSTPMSSPVLVTLADGRVLAIDDGYDTSVGARALIYDPVSGASVSVGPMMAPIASVSSPIRLRDGRVLIIGDPVSEIFDPSTLRFATLGPTVTPRSGASTALLLDGRVLIAGGWAPGVSVAADSGLRSAEIFDPNAVTSSPAGSILTWTGGGPMATLTDGRVFMASEDGAEIFDPATGRFAAAATSALGGRSPPLALPDGRVVVVESRGLYSGGNVAVWDPGSRTFSDHSQLEAVTGGTLLDDGRILLIGVCRGRPAGWTGIFDPTTGVTSPGPGSRACMPKATRLIDGRVLLVGAAEPAAPTVQIFQ